MRRHTLWAAGAVTLSVVLHGLGFGVGGPGPSVQLEGGAPAQVAILGNSFADMAAGVVTPSTSAPDVATQVQPTPVSPVAPPPVSATTPPPVQTTPPPPATSAVPPVQAASVPAAPPALQPVPEPVAKPVPKPRPKPAPKPPKRTKAPPKAAPKPAPRGNSGQSAKRGQADGQTGAKATQSGQARGTSRQAGNAAVSSYPGKVWRKLSRTRKRGRGRGKAVVGFKIASSGGVASAWIIRSSGNAKLDAAALKHVHRAAPFPRPPKGAKRQYSYDYVGK